MKLQKVTLIVVEDKKKNYTNISVNISDTIKDAIKKVE